MKAMATFKEWLRLIWRFLVAVGYLVGALIPIVIAIILLHLMFGKPVNNAVNAVGERVLRWWE